MNLVFTNINRIYGTQPNGRHILKGTDMAEVPFLDHAYLRCRDGIITETGLMQDWVAKEDEQQVSLEGKWLIPGLVDSHTHLVFAAAREEEFRMRISGKSYEEIAAAGGGILNSALKLRQTSEEQLFEDACVRLHLMMAHGTTTVEIKSGYGLDTASELKMLRVIKRLKEHFPMQIRATFLGAHAIPAEFRQDRAGYIRLITDEMLPAIHAEGLADFMDVFCDRGFFSPEETATLLEAGLRCGLRPKIHANELGLTGGVQVGVQFGALSVDHLEHCGPDEIACLLESHTIPVGLPGTSYFLGLPYTPVRALMDAGLPVALASDFNPGSSPGPSLQMTMSLACTQMKMLPEEALNAVTLNAAAALDLNDTCGSLTPGKRADFCVLKGNPSLALIPYHFGVNHVEEVYVQGVRC
ncbi:MAG: imidazolonepropionase [Bacteroidetes bacterium]|nr:imidazolonepropionase [Bacteroidota bacterium]